MDVEPDYSVWKTYAYEQGMHPAILTYLDLKKDAFYSVKILWMEILCHGPWLGGSVRNTYLYEENNFTVDEVLVGQYLRNKRIAREFFFLL